MKNLSLWQFAGFVFSVFLGTLLHFVFEWTGWIFLSPISAVNESTWEHMKILFFPMLIFAFIQQKYFIQDSSAFWWIKGIGIFVGVWLIPVLFYTYNGAFGKTPDWLNILFFFLAAGGAFLLETHLFRYHFSLPAPWVAFLLVLIFAAAFAVFTFFPPKLPLFQDPITGLYGIVK